MKLLLHICCAPCSITYIQKLKEKNYDVDGFWYNPNIHPYTEYKSRIQALKLYSKKINLNTIYIDEYDILKFTKNAIISNRCEYCYKERLEKLFSYAKENNYEAVSTTLITSIYQNYERIIEIGQELEKKYNIKFIYIDIREQFRQNLQKAKELELYMQKYCGCIYSEEERYLKKN